MRQSGIERRSRLPCRRRWLGVLLTLVAATLPACRRDAGPRRIQNSQELLERQIAGLTRLVAAAEQGTLVPNDRIVVAVTEEIVKELAQLALPREHVVAGRYRVRVTQADVRFRDQQGTVRLDGRVSPADRSPNDVFAELAVFGLVDRVDIDAAHGTLSAKVELTGFELKRFGMYAESETGRRLAEAFASTRLEALQALVIPLAIPVRLTQEVDLPGQTDGPVRLKPARFPLAVTVSGLQAFNRRLWVSFEVRSGPWHKLVPDRASVEQAP